MSKVQEQTDGQIVDIEQKDHEALEKFGKEEIKWRELTEEQQQIALYQKEKESTSKGSQDIPEQKMEELEKPIDKQEEPVSYERHKELQELYRNATNDANTLRQQQDSHDYKMQNNPVYKEEYLKKFGVEQSVKQPPVDQDGYSDDGFEDPRIVQMQKEMADLKQTLASNATEQLKKDQYNGVFKEINHLQSEVPNLRTDKPFQEINEAILKAQNLKGGMDANYEDVQNFGITKQDFDKASSILDLHSKADRYPSMRSAYRDSDLFDEHYKSQLNQTIQSANDALKDQARATEQKIKDVSQTKVISSTSHDSPTGIDDAKQKDSDTRWLKSHPRPNTDSSSEMKMRSEIHGRAGIGQRKM